MVEIHGWITLRYSDYHSEDDKQHDFVYHFKQFLQKHCEWVVGNPDSQIGYLTQRNGLDCFTIAAQHNHLGSPFYPLDIFKWVAEHSPGSYGILYFHDDEDEARHNEFRVFTLKRGKLIELKDPFLSPYLEEVEQEYDADNPPLD
jgi:hypothetical protein